MLVLLAGLTFSPAFSLAATTTATSSSVFFNDGSSEWGSGWQERIRGWRGQSSELRQKIDALGSTPVASIAIPILFGVEIRDMFPNFGDPRSGGRTHEGEDIMAAKGTPIVSPTQAVVIRTGTGTTEGNYVYTANPGGETFAYMHLDRVGEGIAVGSILETGALIGYVGNTGNASGGAAHLHFEIRHDRSATDPFPRLTREFTPQEKITYLAKILTQAADQRALAQFLVLNFGTTFKAALANNVPLPGVIVEYLALLPANSARALQEPLPSGDLTLESSGAAVTALQQYLIAKASGPAAKRLAVAGATGYFGPMTKDALVEYQKAQGITPASGYLGPLTRLSIERNPTGIAVAPSTPVTAASASWLTRDLARNSTGEDVRTLQKLLNAAGSIVAVSGAGSPGHESDFFGTATEKAVISFQVARGIKPSVGYVGALTRAALSASI